MFERDRIVYEFGGTAVLLVLGLLFVGSAIWLADQQIYAGAPMLEIGVWSIVVAIPGIMLLYGGYRLHRMDIAPVQYYVISFWCFASIGMLAVLLTMYQFLPHGHIEQFARTVLAVSAIVTVPAFVGGVNHAKARTRTVELERTLDFLEHAESTADVGGWEVDMDSMAVHWTGHLTELLPWDEDRDPELDEALDLFHPDDRSIVQEAISQATEDHAPIDVEARLRDQHGEIRWLRIRGTPEVRGETVHNIRGAALDITERKERELELRKYEQLKNTSNDVIVSIDENSTIQSINPTVADMFGYDPDELVGSSVTRLMPDHLAGKHRSGLERYLESGEQTVDWNGFEVTGVRADGTEIPLSASFCEVEYEGERFFSGFLRDISQRKQRERELERIRDRMEFALTATNAIVWDWNVDDDHVSFYPSEVPLYGTTVDDWEDFIALVHPDDRDRVRSTLEESLETGAPKSEELRIVRDGEIRWIDAPGELVHDDDGTTRMVGIARDITERKTYEHQLEKSNKRLEQFAYAASHDLQEPLRMVSSYLQLIERRYEDDLDEVGQEFLGYAIDGANRMRAMIRGLLKYSRIDTDGTQRESVDLEEIVDTVIEDLAIPISEQAADLEVEELPEVTGDEHQLRQLFQNLLHNAIQYSGEEKPAVTVSAERNGSQYTVSVADDGVGIDPDEQDRIFGLFERLHPQDGPGGSGIGLALCKRIVERHGGTIWVDSAPDEGATFRFTIPSEDGNQLE